MNTFTVQREYPALYRTEVTSEAEDVAAACRAAADVANQSDTWEAHDCEQPTYVVAMAKGADVDPWRLTPEGLMPPSCPSRACSRMWRGSRAIPDPERGPGSPAPHHARCHRWRW